MQESNLALNQPQSLPPLQTHVRTHRLLEKTSYRCQELTRQRACSECSGSFQQSHKSQTRSFFFFFDRTKLGVKTASFVLSYSDFRERVLQLCMHALARLRFLFTSESRLLVLPFFRFSVVTIENRSKVHFGDAVPLAVFAFTLCNMVFEMSSSRDDLWMKMV